MSAASVSPSVPPPDLNPDLVQHVPDSTDLRIAGAFTDDQLACLGFSTLAEEDLLRLAALGPIAVAVPSSFRAVSTITSPFPSSSSCRKR